MIVPTRGDTVSVPLNEAGQELAKQWDPDRDRANGDQCKAYGAGGVMRLSGRIRINWLGDDKLQIHTDAGEQQRVFHFRNIQLPETNASLQGQSRARWEGYLSTLIGQTAESKPGYLKVVTSNLAPGYHRLNGVPYSADTKVTEYYHLQKGYGRDWLTVTTLVVDPLLTKKVVMEVAYLAGFSDLAYFTREFTAQFGISPGRYRRL